MNLAARPITVLIAALGGEGGGVLADWILSVASAEGYPVQSTSIPGVAQRTGATTYYLEIYPVRAAELGERRPVMTLAPAPGDVDVMIASELLEAARALQNGFVTPDRTALIASTHRVYTTVEKIAMGDGRLDSERILEAARALAKRALLFDMHSLAREAGTVISAVMFGALAGSGALPLPRASCEAAIRSSGKGAEASLRGFAAGYSGAVGAPEAPAPGGSGRPHAQPLERVRRIFPAETHAVLELGAERCADYQDAAYGALYLDRLEPIAKLEREQGGAAAGYKLTNETGRFLALWMCYEDVIRVADLKTRRSRFERVRREVRAAPGEPLHIVEFLKPGLEEVAALLPRGLSRGLMRWAGRHGFARRLNVGMQVKTTSLSGFLTLRLLALLRPWRRMSARYADEQVLIERWLGAIRGGAREPALALEIALCGRLIKGYGETHQRGRDNLLRIMDTLVEGGAVADATERASAIRKAREAALADPEGRGLEGSLAAHGIEPLPPKAKPIRFMRRATAARKAA
jgi:indolepyruvate ferredoxin oxidoreductase, beta subunit